MQLGTLVGIVGLLAVAGQVFFANRDSFLTASQMQARGFPKGLPLLYHAGIWGDLVIFTPLLAIIVSLYSDRWSADDIFTSVGIGVVSLCVMGFIWVKAAEHGLPEAHTYGGSMTTAGLIHGMYFAAAVAIIVLFFFHSGITQKAAVIVAVILAVHLIYGTHIVLGLFAPSWYPDRPHKQILTWVIVLVCWSALVWRCLAL